MRLNRWFKRTFLETINALPDSRLEDIFKEAAEKGVGIELNSDDMNFKNEETATILRPYQIAKKEGCKFYLGSDAHHPQKLNEAIPRFERAIELLKLTEDDKFKL